jgi:UDP-N-acetylmuramoyl-tripeptide--D-alanyl-D-alanine ligase
LVSVKGLNFVVAVGEFAPAAQEGARSTQYGKKMQAFLTQEQACTDSGVSPGFLLCLC